MHINRQSYEEFFLLYADGELNENEMKAVEEFISLNPDLAGEFNLIRQTVMIPDDSIIFENKELLFKDEEEERKVIYMRWFRIAAAAAVLIVFSVVGWVFFSNSNINKVPVAIIKQPEAKKPEVADALPSKEIKEENDRQKTESNTPGNTPVAGTEKSEKIKQVNKSTQKENIENNKKEMINEPEVVKNESPEKTPEAAEIKQDVVRSEPGSETIDVSVEPRAIENTGAEQPTNNTYAQSYNQETDNDMIYFANTSLSKKTKLRGVLRKATRYLDRVTSLQ